MGCTTEPHPDAISSLPSTGKCVHLIVVPAFNEAATLPELFVRLQQLPEDFEILIVNDGSTDETATVAEREAAASRLRARVLHLATNGGIGVAVQAGYIFARARRRFEYVIQCDGDGQHDPSYIPAMVEACKARNLDLCVGSRFLEPSNGDRSTRLRRLGIGIFVRLIGFLSGARLTDPTSGLRCAGPHAWERFARFYPEDYPEPESLYWCVKNGLRVGEVPVVMRARAHGSSSIRSWRSVYYMAKVTLAIMVDRLRASERGGSSK